MRYLFNGKDVMAVLPTVTIRQEFNFSVVCQCKMRLTSTNPTVRDICTFNLLFSVRSLEFFLASFVFMKGTSSCVIKRNFW